MISKNKNKKDVTQNQIRFLLRQLLLKHFCCYDNKVFYAEDQFHEDTQLS